MYDEQTKAAYPEDAQGSPERVHKSVAEVVAIHERLGHLISTLADRLTPVLRPSDPRDQSGVLAQVSSPASPLAVAISEQAEHAAAMADQVDRLLARLEL